ncbi:MAG: DUF6542 domain-containing protein [Umezawaea sp.]
METSVHAYDHARTPLQIPSLAAVTFLAVFVLLGLPAQGADLGVRFGIWLVVGMVCAAALVRPVGLWAVVPAPPLLYFALVLGKTTWVGQLHWRGSKELATVLAPWLIHGFPHLATSVVVGLVVALLRAVSRARRR